MAGDWIKLKTGLDRNHRLYRVAELVGATPEAAFFAIYRVVSYFKTHGKYGKVAWEASIVVDSHAELLGLAAAMKDVGWLRECDGVILLSPDLCSVSATRKALGRKVRAFVLDGATCAACGTRENLVIDHKIPIVRGGSCELDNLQALCEPCNRAKGRKTMQEFRL